MAIHQTHQRCSRLSIYSVMLNNSELPTSITAALTFCLQFNIRSPGNLEQELITFRISEVAVDRLLKFGEELPSGPRLRVEDVPLLLVVQDKTFDISGHTLYPLP